MKHIILEIINQQHPLHNTIHTLAVQQQPLKLIVDTPTDWPAVFATTCVGLAVAWMTFTGQKNQIKASKAEFIHEWQKELRDAISKFISIVSIKKQSIEKPLDNYNISDTKEYMLELYAVKSKIDLLLVHNNRDKNANQYYTEIKETMESIILCTNSDFNDSDIDIDKLIEILIEKSGRVLDKAWIDMKNELQGK